MFDFHEKRKIRSILYSKFSIGVLFVIAVFLAFSVHERYVVEREMAKKLDDRKVELESMKQRAQVLETKVEHLENERGIEEELRSRFDVAKDGEQVVIIVDDPAKKGTKTREGSVASTTTVTDSVEKSWWAVLKFW